MSQEQFSRPESSARLRSLALRLTYRVILGGLVLFSGFVAIVVVDGWAAFGKSPDGLRLQRIKTSPQWDDSKFENPQPLYNDYLGMLSSGSDYAAPQSDIPTVHGTADRFALAPASGLRITWLGHSTTLIEIDGVRILTDPVFGERSGPVDWVGPRRWYRAPIPLGELERVDAVVISHDHYDHLDYPTIIRMLEWDTTFIAPIGVGAHLEYWGVARDRIVELDWWERTQIAGLSVVMVPARHASGRHVFDQNHTLWAGYALLGTAHRVYFSGDTGLFPAMADIGERYGPFDVAMIEVGSYDRSWPDWHIGPEQAIRAGKMVRAELFFPIHWGLFDLALHGWTEPIERTLVAAQAASLPVVAPKPGQSIEPSNLPKLERWWPAVPWETAAQHPIVATRME
jgi:L-ascorbate metabolism protein UlaG (beta-lactamase superfamily)